MLTECDKKKHFDPRKKQIIDKNGAFVKLLTSILGIRANQSEPNTHKNKFQM